MPKTSFFYYYKKFIVKTFIALLFTFVLANIANLPIMVLRYLIMSSSEKLLHYPDIAYNLVITPVAIVSFFIVFEKKRSFSSKIAISLFIVFLFLSAELVFPFILLHGVDRDVNKFVSENVGYVDTYPEDVIKNVTEYVDSHIYGAYKRKEDVLKLDKDLILWDYKILELLGFDRAHIIFWQKWGTCYEYARATAYLLNKLGLESRIAHFIGKDHAWAEVKLNGTWYIVDPWYISHYYSDLLVPINILASLPVSAPNYKVTVTYFNGTETDETIEHGFNQTEILRVS